MAVELFVVVGRNIAAGEILLDPGEKLGINGHQVFAAAMDRAFLHHPDLAIALDDLSLYLADFLMDQVHEVLAAGEDSLARVVNAAWAERIGSTRPAKRRLALLPGLQQRLIGPFRRKGRIRIALIEELNGVKGDRCCLAEHPIERLRDPSSCGHNSSPPQINLANPKSTA